MEITEDQIIEKYEKDCKHCTWAILLPYEYELTCFACAYNVINCKKELSKNSWKEINFINRLKCAENEIFLQSYRWL